MSVSAFATLGLLSTSTLEVLQRLGFKDPTPVQKAVIPLFTSNKDVIVEACTGSGKTLAFVIPLIERLRSLESALSLHQIGAIIVAPTRELAGQIYNVAQPFVASAPGVTSLLLVGGSECTADMRKFTLKGAQILIGTPGRLLDIMQRSSCMCLKHLELVILDEADRLLDMGFRTQLDGILKLLPKQRRTGLFSATQSKAVEQLARAGLRNAVRVSVDLQCSGIQIHQQQHKLHNTLSQLDYVQQTPISLEIQWQQGGHIQKMQQLLLFVQLPQLATVHMHALHGRMKQAAREATMAAFVNSAAGCLLCTDVAARGLDIPDVQYIVQYDPPQDPSTFVHRVGRTARMGRIGKALVLLLPHEMSYVEFSRLRKVPMREAPVVASPVTPHLSLRLLSEEDRDVMEKGVKAFVSYIRAYKEHHCKFIFRLADMDFAELATAFGLLQLPRMPELHKARQRLGNFQASKVLPCTVKFKHKARQKQRQQSLNQLAEPGSNSGSGKAADNIVINQMVQKKLPAIKRRRLERQQDDASLLQDYRHFKKLKAGQISEHEFNCRIGIDDPSEDKAGL